MEGAAAWAAIWPQPGNWVVEVQAAGVRSVSVWLHQGCLRTDVLWCVRSSTAQEERGVYQWLEAFRGVADSDLEAAACQSLSPKALRDLHPPLHLDIK